MEEQNSLFPICKMIFIIVIRYDEHDQDGGSMIMVYCFAALYISHEGKMMMRTSHSM